MVPGGVLLWLHCLNLTLIVPDDALMLKNSQLGQNDGVLRVIDSVFVNFYAENDKLLH